MELALVTYEFNFLKFHSSKVFSASSTKSEPVPVGAKYLIDSYSPKLTYLTSCSIYGTVSARNKVRSRVGDDPEVVHCINALKFSS
jgi:hypothetical protein